MGVKLFSWLGGLALFLTAAYFVKYSFEHNLIPPEVRVALGFLLGLGLVVGGERLRQREYTVTSQTLCATGVVILYAVTFAGRAVYHFAFFGQVPTFLLMALITATAFLLAARLEAMVVAILGMLGGFLTPVLLSTGEDHPVGLFTYIALLDAGLVAVALARPWSFLVVLAAAGTAIMELGWSEKFFAVQKVYTALVVFFGFDAFFLTGSELARRRQQSDRWFNGAAAGMALLTLVYSLSLLRYSELGQRPGVLGAFVVGADLCLLALVLREPKLAWLQLAGGALAHLFVAIWASQHLTDALLPWALGLVLLFAVLHSVFPIVLQRLRPHASPVWWAHLFPPLALLLMLIPLFRLAADSLVIWPAILLVDLLAIGLAVATASLVSIVTALLVTGIVTAAWIFQVPVEVTVLPLALWVVVGMAVVFFLAGLFAVRMVAARWPEKGLADELARAFGGLTPTRQSTADEMRAQIPALSCAERHGDPQLVSLCLRRERRILFCRGPALGAASAGGPGSECPARLEHSGHRARVFAGEHRDRRLLHRARRSDAHISFHRQLCSRHDLHDRVGGLCARSGCGGDRLEGSRRAVRRPRVVERDVAQRATGFALSAALLLFATVPLAAAGFSEWARLQQIEVPSPGLVRVALPPETFDAAQASLADLRLADASTNEVPYLIERPRPSSRAVRAEKNWQIFLEDARTRIEWDVKPRGRLAAFSFETPAEPFLKAVTVNADSSGAGRKQLVAGQPIFRQPGGVAQLTVKLPDGAWSHLSILLDDQKSKPIPITGLLSHEEDAAVVPPEAVAARLVERVEAPGETRLTVDLGASRLPLSGVRFETSEPLFTRKVSVVARQWENGEVRERALGGGTIYRIAVDDQSSGAQLEFPLDGQPPGSELVLVLDNGDSPPLPVSEITFLRWPVHLVFYARQAGRHSLFSGNPRAATPRYDVAALATQLKDVPLSRLQVGALSDNPSSHPAEPLPEVPVFGAAIDSSAWPFRRPVQISAAGIQQLELPPHVLAHAQASLADLRVVASGKQVPYLLERTSFSRSLSPEVTKADDPNQPRLSRWQIKLPQSGLPITKLASETKAALFQREARVYEQAPDTRGQHYRRDLGSGSWMRQPGRRSGQFSVPLHALPFTDTILLEIDNGDNPGLELEQFQVFYPVHRLLFKTPPNEKPELCYGNPKAVPPSYDLKLVAAQMLAATKSPATLAGPEPTAVSRGLTGETGSWLFWGVLAIVVAGLLVIIARLLPKGGGKETPRSS